MDRGFEGPSRRDRFAALVQRLSHLAEKGPLRAVQIVAGRLLDSSFDMRFGTDTVRRVSLDGLRIASANKERGTEYAPTPARSLRKLLREIPFPPDSVFVDFGSGKGRTLLMAALGGFRKVVGVEFSEHLCAVAEWNVTVIRDRLPSGVEVLVHCSDAADYRIDADQNVFFLFNPFDGVVLAKALANIRESLAQRPRRIWIVYYNPMFAEVLARDTEFVHWRTWEIWGETCVAYVNRSLEP